MIDSNHERKTIARRADTPPVKPLTKHEFIPLNNVKQKRYVSPDLFDENFPGAVYSTKNLEGDYVSEVITSDFMQKEFFESWNPKQESYKFHPDYQGIGHQLYKADFPLYKQPIVLWAQTGKGKNYFITNSLREFAKQHNQKILYVCNRVALNYQQKRDLALATNVGLNPEKWEETREFGNVTVFTYQSLEARLRGDCESFCKSFDIVILDECHYFYSDSFFNAWTGFILAQIPQKFLHCYRIYMSATPEAVLDPIYSAELTAIKNDLSRRDTQRIMTYLWDMDTPNYKEYLPKIKIFRFEPDYSVYKPIYFFTRDYDEPQKYQKRKQDIPVPAGNNGIIDLIYASRKSRKKWVIFVTQKEYGKNLAEALTNLGIPALSFNRNSRNSDDPLEQAYWRSLMKKGKLDKCMVLITTSVLDNGFSIKDEDVGNVVLFTDDRTEFLQQLGRVRLIKHQFLNIYIAKTSKAYDLNESTNNIRKGLFDLYYNNPDEDKNRALSVLGRMEQYPQFSVFNYIRFIGVAETENQLIAEMNHMARHRTKLIEAEIEKYKKLEWALGENRKNEAQILYKLEWLHDKDGCPRHYTDIDRPPKQQGAKELEELLTKFLDCTLVEPGPKSKRKGIDLDESAEEEKFREFSQGIEHLGKKYLGLRNNGQEPLKHTAIKNWLEKLEKNFGNFMKNRYDLVETKKKTYVLQVKEHYAGSVKEFVVV